MSRNLLIVGANSRLAVELKLEPARKLSLRPGAGELPESLEGTILIFADPSSVDQTRSGFLDLMSRIPLGSKTSIVLISSISASFGESKAYPSNGPYTQRKRLAEQLVSSRQDVKSLLLRVGNVREFGGWNDIFSNCRIAVLPKEVKHVAVADLAVLRQMILADVTGSGDIVNAYTTVEVGTCFTRVVRVPGLLGVYKSRVGRIAIKIAAKILRRNAIFMPSPDDLNAFLMEPK